MVDQPTLAEQLASTKQAVNDLTEAVELLTLATRRTRWWVVALGVILALVIALGAFTIWFAITTREDLRDFGEQLFLNSCTDVNESRATANEGRIQQAEILIKIFNADETRPELAAQYREMTRQLNEQFPQRNCQNELNKVDNEEAS